MVEGLVDAAEEGGRPGSPARPPRARPRPGRATSLGRGKKADKGINAGLYIKLEILFFVPFLIYIFSIIFFPNMLFVYIFAPPPLKQGQTKKYTDRKSLV